MHGITYKTFSASVDQVHAATRQALERMRININQDHKTDTGRDIVCKAADREIDVQLKSLAPRVTRMRVVANESLFVSNSVTATDIIMETADSLQPSWMLAANCH